MDKKPKKENMKFYTTIVFIEDRHTEPKVEDIPMGHPMPAKHEEITLTVRLISSGNTKPFKNRDIVDIVMERLEMIEPKKNQT